MWQNGLKMNIIVLSDVKVNIKITWYRVKMTFCVQQKQNKQKNDLQ